MARLSRSQQVMCQQCLLEMRQSVNVEWQEEMPQCGTEAVWALVFGQ